MYSTSGRWMGLGAGKWLIQILTLNWMGNCTSDQRVGVMQQDLTRLSILGTSNGQRAKKHQLHVPNRGIGAVYMWYNIILNADTYCQITACALCPRQIHIYIATDLLNHIRLNWPSSCEWELSFHCFNSRLLEVSDWQKDCNWPVGDCTVQAIY